MSRSVSRGLSLGPVFAYDWIKSSRRWQGYALRSAFVLFLLSALAYVWINTRFDPAKSKIRVMAELGEWFFQAVIGTQLTLVLLAAPAATAGAICLDRARGTLLHMLMTDLADFEIVLGKLAARLVPVVGLVACTLPVMQLLIFLGGVAPEAVWGAFVVTLGVALLGCSLGLLLSLWAGKTHEALLGTYALWCLWLLGLPLLETVATTMGWSVPLPPLSINPFFLALSESSPGTVTLNHALAFLGASSAISALMIAWVILRLRRVCTRQSPRKPWSRYARPPAGKIGRILRSPLPGMSPPLDRNPLLWRERRRGRPSPWAIVVTFASIILASTATIAAVLLPPATGVAEWVNGSQIAVGLLILCVLAATALGEERTRGSLDVLLSTPFSARQLVLAKWFGTIRRLALPALLPGLVIWMRAPHGGFESVPAVAFMMAYVLCAGAAVTSLGLAIGTWFSQIGRAVSICVGIFLFVTLGPCYLAPMLWARNDGSALLSPLLWTGTMTIDVATPTAVFTPIDWAIFWMLMWALVAVGLLALTLANFDRRLGRVETVVARLAHPSRWAQIAAMICFTLGAIFSIDSLLLWPLGDRAFWINGPTCTAALFLAGAASATSLFDGRDAGGVDLLMKSELSSGRIVLAKWLGACRLLPPLLIVPAWVVIRCGAPLSGLLLFSAYLFSVSAAVISLGLACATALKQRGRAVAVTAGLIGLVLVAGPVFADLRTAGADTRNLAMGSPWSGVTAMTLELGGYHSSELSFTIWALGWSLGYCICAAVLLGVTIATFDRRLGRAAIGGHRSGPIRASSARAAPVTPQ
jgi:ABC-type transport system involved in multi-copper enzyme maturation permease subunit